jgi:hypothetical protein
MLAEMEKKAAASHLTPGGFQYNALQAGAGAIIGGLAGYSVGQQSSSAVSGALGGALAGASAGSAFGPWGAAAGAVVGLTTGIIGFTNAAAKAREAAEAFIKTFDLSLKQYHDAVFGITSTVGQQLAQNAQQAQALRDQVEQNLAGKRNQTARESRLIDIGKDEFQGFITISANFWDSIAQQLNHLKGPAGDYQNQLLALQKQYDDNTKGAIALSATTEQLDQINQLYQQSLKQLQDAEQKRIDQLAQQAQRAGEDIAVRGIRAQGFGSQADAMAFQLQQTRELQDAIAAGMDPTTLALLQNTLALEATAFAAQQLAAQMQQNRSDIGRDVRLGFTTGAAGLEQERAALGFGGLSNEDIKAMYTIFTGTPLSQSQEDLNSRIEQFLTDAGQWMPAATSAADSVANAVDTYNKTSVGTVTGISDAQANGVLGRLDTSNTYLGSIDSTLRNWFSTGSSASALQSPTGFRTAGTNITLQLMMPNEEWDAVLAASPTMTAAIDRASGIGLTRVRAGAGGTRT